MTQEEYDKVLTNLKKKGEAYVRSYLIRSGASVSWVESLSKEDAFTHALVLKGALKERLPFKKAEKDKSGDAMEMFMQLMKSQEAERKEKNLKEEARIAKEEAEKRRGLQKRKRRERRGLQKKKEK